MDGHCQSIGAQIRGGARLRKRAAFPVVGSTSRSAGAALRTAFPALGQNPYRTRRSGRPAAPASDLRRPLYTNSRNLTIYYWAIVRPIPLLHRS